MIEIAYSLVITILGWIGFIGIHIILLILNLQAKKEELLGCLIISSLLLVVIWLIALTSLGEIKWV